MNKKTGREPAPASAPAIAGSDRAAHNVRELEQRIDTLQQLDDAALGRFTCVDWWVLLIAAVLLPIVAFIAAA